MAWYEQFSIIYHIDHQQNSSEEAKKVQHKQLVGNDSTNRQFLHCRRALATHSKTAELVKLKRESLSILNIILHFHINFSC